MPDLLAQDIHDAAFLAATAYTSTSAGLVPLLEDEGWQPLGAVELGMSASLFGADASDSDYLFIDGNAEAFVAYKDGALAIAFRGTNGGADYTDNLNGLGDGFQRYYNRFEALNDAVIAFAANPPPGALPPGATIDKILVAGHSLGGAAAENFMQEFGASHPTMVGASFGAPSIQSVTDFGPRFVSFEHTQDSIVDRGVNPVTEIGNELRVARLEGNSSSLDEHGRFLYLDSAEKIFGGVFAELLEDSYLDFSITVGRDAGDTIAAGADPAAIFGGAGNDSVTGGSAGDLLSGGLGDDTLAGGGGDDVLSGGKGTNTHDGGAGADVVEIADTYKATGFAFDGTHLVVTSAGGLTVDRVIGVELLRFADGSEVSLREVSGGVVIKYRDPMGRESPQSDLVTVDGTATFQASGPGQPDGEPPEDDHGPGEEEPLAFDWLWPDRRVEVDEAGQVTRVDLAFHSGALFQRFYDEGALTGLRFEGGLLDVTWEWEAPGEQTGALPQPDHSVLDFATDADAFVF